ncbi:hypothetical protein ACK3BK_10125 [Pseudomonas sp. L7]
MICCKRVYQSASPEYGQRVLADRFWPRKLCKAGPGSSPTCHAHEFAG